MKTTINRIIGVFSLIATIPVFLVDTAIQLVLITVAIIQKLLFWMASIMVSNTIELITCGEYASESFIKRIKTKACNATISTIGHILIK